MTKQTENKMTQLTVDNDRLQTKVEVLERGIKNMHQLMLASGGVYYHPKDRLLFLDNDDIQYSWACYFPGGKFEEDLTDFFAAVEYLKNEKNET